MLQKKERIYFTVTVYIVTHIDSWRSVQLIRYSKDSVSIALLCAGGQNISFKFYSMSCDPIIRIK